MSRTNINRALELGPRMLVHYAWKLSRLKYLYTTQYWQRFEKQVQTFWSSNHTEDWLALARDGELLIGPAQLEAFLSWSAHHPEWVMNTQAKAENICSGYFSIFDQTYHFDLDDIPWHTDWRSSYTWKPAYYQSYRFNVHKDVPADVKFPWELSRFSFLLPLAQMAVIGDQESWHNTIAKITADWEHKNPLGYSVNWQAMICAIHGINLALAVQILASGGSCRLDTLMLLLRQLTLQGEFLFHNIEYTKIRGNHYASNLAGLLLMGTTLQQIYRPASRWVDYAAPRICSEIEAQYCEDGVHFEKTTSYHRLVTEFFLLSLFILEKMEYPISVTAQERMKQACEYIRCYTRPDGYASNWGDNDGAWLLAFDPRPLRDHRSLLALAAVYFDEPAFKVAAQQPSATIPWLLGAKGVQDWNRLPICANAEQIACLFQAGGMVVSKSSNHYLIADFGEVGRRGTGGHGHNDTFSFELCLYGKPIIVDPGSPIYTGDAAMMARYSSTAYHNTLRIDQEEMARLIGTWRISNEAAPTNVRFQSGSEVDMVEGEHRGYTRLSDPVIHKRTLEFYKHQGRLLCKDLVCCTGLHHVEQFLHFAPGLNVILHSDKLCIHLGLDKVVSIRWTPTAQARIEKTQVSETFGHLADSLRLVLEYEITGETELSFEIISDDSEINVQNTP